MNYLKPELKEKLQDMSVLGLAHVGDAVYELMIRTWLCSLGGVTAKKLHLDTVKHVSAKAQAVKMGKILPLLSDEEHAIYKRGRNAHVNNVPRGSTIEEYHAATGLETLIGYLYLSGNTNRLGELFDVISKT